MKYIGIVSDISWDNFILINNKFKKIDDENFTLHFIYNKNLQMFSNCAYNNNLTIIRNSGKSICNCAYNLLKACDIWLVFTNNIEYLTLPQLIISKCTEFNIKYIIISEYSRDNDIYSFDKSSSSFKKTINNISTCENKINVELFNYNDYNLSYESIIPNLVLTSEIINKIRQSNLNMDKQRKEKSISLLYNKNEYKMNKTQQKSSKELKTVEYLSNRMNYYK